MFKFNNGDKVKDVVTKLEGVITGRCDYLTGCKQMLVVPESVDGEFKEGHWFDEDRLVMVSEQIVVLNVETNGPDKPGSRRH